jgi:hypothetical protein
VPQPKHKLICVESEISKTTWPQPARIIWNNKLNKMNHAWTREEKEIITRLELHPRANRVISAFNCIPEPQRTEYLEFFANCIPLLPLFWQHMGPSALNKERMKRKKEIKLLGNLLHGWNQDPTDVPAELIKMNSKRYELLLLKEAHLKMLEESFKIKKLKVKFLRNNPTTDFLDLASFFTKKRAGNALHIFLIRSVYALLFQWFGKQCLEETAIVTEAIAGCEEIKSSVINKNTRDIAAILTQ